jgi:hypothetical protein
VTFSKEADFIIHNDDVPFSEVGKYIPPDVLKQLLNPKLYEPILSTMFDKELENLDQPEPEEDDYESYYDRD